jgi:hypothetical protein
MMRIHGRGPVWCRLVMTERWARTMVQTYNPPPNWPTPPLGWVPPPDWQPDPSWGPLPYGWKLWLDDGSPKAGLDAILAQTTLRADGQRVRRRGVTQYIIALAFVIVAGIAAYKAVHDGVGLVWTGGFLVAAALTFRAVRNFRLATQIATPMTVSKTVVLAVAGLLALTPSFMSLAVVSGAFPKSDKATWTTTPPAILNIASCWTAFDGSGNTYRIACSSPLAKLIAVSETSTPQTTCTDIYVEISATKYLCLSPKP